MTIEIETNSMSSGLQIKNDISGFIRDHISTNLEHYFNQNIPENECWKFDQINLELQLNSITEIKNSAPHLITKIASICKGQDHQNDPPTKELITNKSYQRDTFSAFNAFIKTGSYPWWFEPPKDLVISDFGDPFSATFRRKLVNLFHRSVHLDRLIYQFDNQFIKDIYCIMFNVSKTPVSTVVSGTPSLLKNQLKAHFWQRLFLDNEKKLVQFFKEVLQEIAPVTTTEQSLLHSIKKSEVTALFELLDYCNDQLQLGIILLPISGYENSFEISRHTHVETAISANKKHRKQIIKILGDKGAKNTLHLIAISAEKTTQLVSKITPYLIQKKLQKLDTHKAKLPIEKQNDVALSIEQKHHQSDTEFSEEELHADGVLVEKAGLVLLHPFLKHFFINMDLLDGNQIRPGRKDAAAHLLHYIATKETQPSEHELLLEKYLCNIPNHQPINRFIELSVEQKSACDDLLKAVLKHWSGLRTNSIDALRSEFLLRTGKLVVSEDKQQLFIERTTTDILLDTLPWNLHLVKLPWKKQLLYVEW